MFARVSSKTALKAAASIISIGAFRTTFDEKYNGKPSYCEAASSKIASSESISKKRIVIVGGGTAGIGVAAQCRNEGLKDVTIVEPKSVHYYQPLWTLVGCGLQKNIKSVRDMKDIVPNGTKWVQAAVQDFDPDHNKITLNDGAEIEYDYLVVATGIQIDWDTTPGLVEGLEKENSGVVSIYHYDYSAKTQREFKSLQNELSANGSTKTMLFTYPPTAIKCAGAPQKIMWVLEDILRRARLRDYIDIQFWTPAPTMFGVPYYSNKLEAIRNDRGVTALHGFVLKSINVEKKIATFQNVGSKQMIEKPYDFLHVAPNMSPPNCIKKSPLSDKDGWIDVDKHTMQSTRYSNVFGLGDCTNTPNSKTAAAVIAQSPVVMHNLLQLMKANGSSVVLDGKYDGYASCPLLTGIGKCILAEFKYGGELAETFSHKTGKFPLNLIGTEGWLQERFFFWLKNRFFAQAYWNLWVRGLWYGRNGPFKPNVVNKEL